MTFGEWAMLIALAALWGGSFFFNAVAVRELPVLTVVTLRVVLGAAILLAFLGMMGERLAKGRQLWLAFIAMGILNNAIPFTLIVWGQQHIASGVASILNASTPLFTVVLAHFLTAEERLTSARLAGVLIGLGGVGVLIGPDAVRQIGAQLAAQILCLGAAISYAFAGIYGRRFRTMDVSPLATATGQLIASSMILLPVALMSDRPWLLPMPSPETILAVLGVAAISTALAYVLYFRILVTAGATNLLLVTFLIPVSAVLLGVLCLGEVLLARHILGMGCIGLGLAAIDGRLMATPCRRRGMASD